MAICIPGWEDTKKIPGIFTNECTDERKKVQLLSTVLIKIPQNREIEQKSSSQMAVIKSTEKMYDLQNL